jgi:hypothetical protein
MEYDHWLRKTIDDEVIDEEFERWFSDMKKDELKRLLALDESMLIRLKTIGLTVEE